MPLQFVLFLYFDGIVTLQTQTIDGTWKQCR